MAGTQKEVLPIIEKQTEVKQPELLNIETQIDETIASIENGTQNAEENMNEVINRLKILKTQYWDNPDIQAKIEKHIQKLSEISNSFKKEFSLSVNDLINTLNEIA